MAPPHNVEVENAVKFRTFRSSKTTRLTDPCELWHQRAYNTGLLSYAKFGPNRSRQWVQFSQDSKLGQIYGFLLCGSDRPYIPMKVQFWHGTYYTVGGPLSDENLALNCAEIECRSLRSSQFDKILRHFSGLYVTRTMKVKFDKKQHLMERESQDFKFRQKLRHFGGLLSGRGDNSYTPIKVKFSV